MGNQPAPVPICRHRVPMCVLCQLEAWADAAPPMTEEERTASRARADAWLAEREARRNATEEPRNV